MNSFSLTEVILSVVSEQKQKSGTKGKYLAIIVELSFLKLSAFLT